LPCKDRGNSKTIGEGAAVRGTNLAREQARERAALVHVQSYDVRLDWSGAPDPQAATFASETVVRFAARVPGAATFIDLIAPHVREITLNVR
jgi:aminopeptidase N